MLFKFTVIVLYLIEENSLPYHFLKVVSDVSLLVMSLIYMCHSFALLLLPFFFLYLFGKIFVSGIGATSLRNLLNDWLLTGLTGLNHLKTFYSWI